MTCPQPRKFYNRQFGGGHNEEKDCYNEDGDHDDYHCLKCEISKLKDAKCVICEEPVELNKSSVWYVFYLCKKCEDKF